MAGNEPPFPVGGQAVIEGVMMRAKHTLAIAVKRPDGSITIKEDRLHTLAEKFPFLRWPLSAGPGSVIGSTDLRHQGLDVFGPGVAG